MWMVRQRLGTPYCDNSCANYEVVGIDVSILLLNHLKERRKLIMKMLEFPIAGMIAIYSIYFL